MLITETMVFVCPSTYIMPYAYHDLGNSRKNDIELYGVNICGHNNPSKYFKVYCWQPEIVLWCISDR